MNRQTISLEVCANSVVSALAAQDGGAARVELCANLHEGGTTPSFGEILIARKHLHIKLYVLIRPRNGDFLFDDREFEIMLADARNCGEAGCDGIAIGILNSDGTVDKQRCLELAGIAKQWGMGVTFNRAFDVCAEPYQAMEDIIELGIQRILTSGGKSTAMEGASVIAHLVEKAAGRIIIVPGGGISESNAADLVRYTGISEIHASARTQLPSKMQYKNDHIILSDHMGDEYSFDRTNIDRVRNILRLANS